MRMLTPLLIVLCAAAFLPSRARADDPSVAPMRAVIDRYAEDRGALSRTYSQPLSSARRERMGRFLDERSKALGAVDFDKLDQAGKVDYLLLRNELRFQQKQLAHRQKELDEVAALLPFAQPIVELELARRRVEEMDSAKAAKALTEVKRHAEEVRKSLEQKLGRGGGKSDVPSPVLANRAAAAVDELRDTLR